MDSQTPHEGDEPDDRVMTGDGAADREGPKPTMTAQGAVVDDESPDDMVMTGDGAEPRRDVEAADDGGRRPRRRTTRRRANRSA